MSHLIVYSNDPLAFRRELSIFNFLQGYDYYHNDYEVYYTSFLLFFSFQFNKEILMSIFPLLSQ
jgi:hypothetical protein